MSNFTRSHTCGMLKASDIGKTVTLSGWVHRRRDHGGLIFIDLRDRFGVTQLVFRPETHPEAHKLANNLRAEWVISIEGKVIARAPGMVNTKLATGEIEVEADKLNILSKAKTPPFSICDEHVDVSEELCLKYRYLDIRRGYLAHNLVLRHKAMMATRKALDAEGFLEMTTPILGKSTPEGARDYLVPSRVYPGSFYALPQSPQLFKQLLMISGMDRYFQIAVCFRDEDSRADRQPEFAQIDIEMSFGTPEQFFPIIEKLICTIFKETLQVTLQTPFRRMPHKEAMERYGSDKPDLRYGAELVRIDNIAAKSQFSVFLDALKRGDIIKAICVEGGADLSRRQIEEYTSFVSRFGAHGLAWIKLEQEGPSSSIVKFFDKEVLDELIHTTKAKTGDLIFMIASDEKTVNQSMDHLRRKLASDRGWIKKDLYELAWITDFPLFQWDATTQRYECEHHPFTSPNPDDIHLLDSDPLKARSSSYDLVLNGYELGSGSQRIFNGDLQKKIFDILKLTPDEIEKRFGFFIEALQYGTPPHMGIGLGFDRIMMLIAGADTIKDVIAFPKTQKAYDLMLEAPSPVLKEQLLELKIHVEHDK